MGSPKMHGGKCELPHTQELTVPMQCPQVALGPRDTGILMLSSTSKIGKHLLWGYFLGTTFCTFFSLQHYLFLYLQNRAQELEGLNDFKILAVYPSLLLSELVHNHFFCICLRLPPSCQARNIHLSVSTI